MHGFLIFSSNWMRKRRDEAIMRPVVNSIVLLALVEWFFLVDIIIKKILIFFIRIQYGVL